MRINKKEMKRKKRRPEVRTMKIQPRFRENKYSTVQVPEIRLSGFWLDKLGFAEGRLVTITTMPEFLILRLDQQSV